MAFSGTVAIRAMKAGDYQATTFAGTQAGLQSALDYVGTTGGEVRIGPGTISNITNLTMYANTTLRGSGMNGTVLERSASATGTCLREKTQAEGNGTSGATGIWLRDFKIDGNGSAGDGIDMGNQGQAQLNINAGIDHVFVSDFTTGYGMKLNGNATYGNHMWSNSNAYGFYFSGGGSNKYYGIWAEGNSTANIVSRESDNSYFGVHTEETVSGATNPSIDLEAGNQCYFYGVTISVQEARGSLIILRSGLARHCFYHIRITTSGSGSFTNGFYSDALTTGTGNSQTIIPFLIDGGPHTFPGLFFNSSNNEWAKLSGAGGLQLQAQGTSVASAATITLAVGLTGGNFFEITGTADITSINTTARQAGRVVTLLFSGTAAATGLTDGSNLKLAGNLGYTPDDTITLISNGTNWYEVCRSVN